MSSVGPLVWQHFPAAGKSNQEPTEDVHQAESKCGSKILCNPLPYYTQLFFLVECKLSLPYFCEMERLHVEGVLQLRVAEDDDLVGLVVEGLTRDEVFQIL
jgi:hypothetical protein